MPKRSVWFSDLSQAMIDEGKRANVRLTFPEGHRKAGTHVIDVKEDELGPLLQDRQNNLVTATIRFPEGNKPPVKITAPAGEIEKVLGEALIGSTGSTGRSSSRRGNGAAQGADRTPLVLETVKSLNKPVIVNEVADHVGMSRDTVRRLLTQLVESGQLKEAGKRSGTMGKAPMQYLPA